MQVDYKLYMAVSDRLPRTHSLSEAIAATLAVAVERGLLVPDDAPRMWAVKTPDLLNPLKVFRTHTAATSSLRDESETVVRVAVVEVKE